MSILPFLVFAYFALCPFRMSFSASDRQITLLQLLSEHSIFFRCSTPNHTWTQQAHTLAWSLSHTSDSEGPRKVLKQGICWHMTRHGEHKHFLTSIVENLYQIQTVLVCVLANTCFLDETVDLQTCEHVTCPCTCDEAHGQDHVRAHSRSSLSRTSGCHAVQFAQGITLEEEQRPMFVRLCWASIQIVQQPNAGLIGPLSTTAVAAQYYKLL